MSKYYFLSIHSDSDEEQRFTEAAVSAETILSGSAIAPIEKFKENHFKSTYFKDVDETQGAQRRRRRKKRKDSDDSGQIFSQKTSDHASETVMPRKKRKNKNKEKNE